MTGTWRGVTVDAGNDNRYLTVASIRHTGQRLEGTIKFTEQNGGDYAEFRLQGRVDGRSVTFQAVEKLSHQLGWCFPAGALGYTRDKSGEHLTGKLARNAVTSDCSHLMRGSTTLSRK